MPPLPAPHVAHIEDEEDAPRTAGAGGDIDVTKALQHIDTGLFHALAIGVLGLANASDSVEVMAIGFILPAIEKDWNVTGPEQGVLSASVFAGMLVGGFVGGAVSDLLGRKRALMTALILNGIFAFGAAFSPNLIFLCLCRALAGIGVGASVPPVFSLAAELLPRAKVGFWLSVIAWAWTAGMVMVAAMAWVVMGAFGMSWRVFAAAAAAPALAAAFCLAAFVPESPRWLNGKGKTQEATAVLTSIAKVNEKGEGKKIFGTFFCSGRDYSRSKLAAGDQQLPRSEPMFPIPGLPSASSPADATSSASPQQQQQPSVALTTKAFQGTASTLRAVRELFTTTTDLRRATVSMLLCWASLSLAWYGLGSWIPQLYSQVGIEGSLYADTFIAAASNVPGNLLASLILDRFDRRKLLSVSMLLTTAMFVVLALVKTEGGVLIVTSLLNAVSVTSWASLNVLSAEGFPTKSRSTAMGLLSATGRLGSIIGQLLFGHLLKGSALVLLLIVAGLLLLGAGAALFYPKDAGKALTAGDGELVSAGGGKNGSGSSDGGSIGSIRSTTSSDAAFLLSDAGGGASTADVFIPVYSKPLSVSPPRAASPTTASSSTSSSSGGSGGQLVPLAGSGALVSAEAGERMPLRLGNSGNSSPALQPQAFGGAGGGLK